MVNREQARQIGCVVRRLRMLMEDKAKGSVVIHLDGSGYLGKQWEVHLFEWKDNYSSIKLGIQIDEDEFFRIMLEQKNKEVV